MRRRIVAATVGAAMLVAVPASAHHVRYTDEPQVHTHANIAHWDYAQWLVSYPGTVYGQPMIVFVAQEACASVGQGSDPNCNNFWNYYLDDAIAAWNNAHSFRQGPRVKFARLSALGGNPCSSDASASAYAAAYVVPVCYDGANDPVSYGYFDYDTGWVYSHGAWHVHGGRLVIKASGFAAGATRARNLFVHEFGHILGLGHRGGYGYDDPWSGQYHRSDPAVNPLMGWTFDTFLQYPDTHDVDQAVIGNGGYIYIGGQRYCWNAHTSCPGTNLVG